MSRLLRPFRRLPHCRQPRSLPERISNSRLLPPTVFSLVFPDRKAIQLSFKVGGGNMGDKGDDTDTGNAAVEESPFPLTETDKYVLSLTDEEYQYHTWDEVKEIIGKWSALV